MFKLDEKYLSHSIRIPRELCKGMSDHVVIFQADNGNHFTHYGVYEGSYLFVDLEKGWLPGHLSCFSRQQENSAPLIKLSDTPLEDFSHIGRVMLILGKNEVHNNEVIYNGKS